MEEREKGFEPSTLTLARYRSNSAFGSGQKPASKRVLAPNVHGDQR
jgi:hypothetical protein